MQQPNLCNTLEPIHDTIIGRGMKYGDVSLKGQMGSLTMKTLKLFWLDLNQPLPCSLLEFAVHAMSSPYLYLSFS